MKRVSVVGAGFAGLTAAYELIHEGFEVTVYEKLSRPGGLIGTHSTPCGSVETAANAILVSSEIENLFTELNLKFAPLRSARHKRYIFWNRPRRWPLGAAVTARLAFSALRLGLGGESMLPRAGESIAEWARRFAGEEFEERLLAPALQGIYAGDPEQMSAVLVLRSLLAEKPPRGRLKGSVSPAKGMGSLIEALEKYIRDQGAEVKYKSAFEMPDSLTSPTVIATSAWAAAEILRPRHPKMAARLERCQSLPLISVTCFFDRSEDDLQGFGCLFPRGQGFSSLGVLFNDCVFAGRTDRRSDVRSETWILGGAGSADLIAESDLRLLERIERDRKRLSPSNPAPPIHFEITRWPRAIPHYTLDWERTLLELNPEPPLYLHGNYLGELGLARIYSRSKRLARQIKDNHG